jgi:hypothetical protein
MCGPRVHVKTNLTVVHDLSGTVILSQDSCKSVMANNTFLPTLSPSDIDRATQVPHIFSNVKSPFSKSSSSSSNKRILRPQWIQVLSVVSRASLMKYRNFHRRGASLYRCWITQIPMFSFSGHILPRRRLLGIGEFHSFQVLYGSCRRNRRGKEGCLCVVAGAFHFKSISLPSLTRGMLKSPRDETVPKVFGAFSSRRASFRSPRGHRCRAGILPPAATQL